MYRFERTGRVKNGKEPEAFLWAVEITKFINEKYSQVSLQVDAQVFGDSHNIYWYADHEDLATVESVLGQIMSDQDYLHIVNEGVEFFIDGRFYDTIMTSH